MNKHLESIATQEKITSGLQDMIGSPTQGTETSTTHTVLLNIVLRMIEDGEIGVRALVNRFNESGMADEVRSWVGRGPNECVSAEEVESVLGKDHVEAISKEAGIPHEEVTAELCQILPLIIDKFTPEGKIPEPAIIQQAASLLRTKL